MTNKNFLPTIVLVSACVLTGLSACDHPNAIPSGYTHHGGVYKSAEPPPSPKFTEEQRATMTLEQADQFRTAVYTLVETLTKRAGVPPKSVYIMQPEQMTPFYANFDNNLRESARHLGYVIADYPDDNYIVTYTAEVQRNPDGTPKPSSSGANVRIAIQVYDKLGEGSKMLIEEWTTVRINGAEELTIPFAPHPGMSLPDVAPSRNNLAN